MLTRLKDANCLIIIIREKTSMYQFSVSLPKYLLSKLIFFIHWKVCARSWSKYASQLIHRYFDGRKWVSAWQGFSYRSNLQVLLLEALELRDVRLCTDYLSSQCSNNNLFFDKKFMAGCRNISLLMIKVSTVLDTSKQDFWIISSKAGYSPGPGGYANYEHSILINVLSVFLRHLTDSCFEDECSFYNPRGTKGKVLALWAWSLHYHWGFNIANCLWPQIFRFPVFQDLGHPTRYLWQSLATIEKFPCQGPDLCWKYWVDVPMTNQWPSELMLERRIVHTCRGLAGNMDTKDDPVAEAAYSTTISPSLTLANKIPAPTHTPTPRSRMNPWLVGDSCSGLISFAEAPAYMWCHSGSCIMKMHSIDRDIWKDFLPSLRCA